MNNKRKKVIVILGPTSSGKSEMAAQLAKKFKGEIISADSRQIFKDMNLGTGKVEGEWIDVNNKEAEKNLRTGLQDRSSKQIAKFKTLLSLSPKKGKRTKRNEEIFVYKNIPHYLIDFVDPKDEYNVSHFKKDCETLIDEILAREKIPIICGGTGFWITSIVNDIDFPAVKPNEKLRKELANKDIVELLKILKKIDSKRAETVDQKNKIRLIRAIEIVKELGKVPNLDVFKSKKNKKYQFLQIGIDCSKKDLESKIKKRLESRFFQGMIEEIEGFKERDNLSWEKIQSFGLGYYWIPLFLQNKISKEELKQKVFEAERRYAKRQRTWFRKHNEVEWVGGMEGAERLVKGFVGLKK